MASLFKVEFHPPNLRALKAKLGRMRGAVRGKLLKEGAQAGAEVYARGMRSRAPIGTGVKKWRGDSKGGPQHLRDNIKATSRKTSDLSARGTANSRAYYSTWVEHGHGGPGGRGGQVAAPKPFVRPTLDNDSPRAAAGAHNHVLRGIENA